MNDSDEAWESSSTGGDVVDADGSEVVSSGTSLISQLMVLLVSISSMFPKSRNSSMDENDDEDDTDCFSFSCSCCFSPSPVISPKNARSVQSTPNRSTISATDVEEKSKLKSTSSTGLNWNESTKLLQSLYSSASTALPPPPVPFR
ncbi:hypothetical protein ABW19_dt0204301 [Dactylella cylindrospora]|nr:hypothetical protein ABW19_dt0204301 [Dactylella cylindrospora]